MCRIDCERPLPDSAVGMSDRSTNDASKRAYYVGREPSPELGRHYFRHLGPVGTVLDVGCGTGGLGRHRPSAKIVVHGVDVDPGAIDLARSHEEAVCVDLVVSPLPYDDQVFDAVLAKDVLEHFHDPARLVREIFRVLRPGGVVVASVIMAKPRRVWDDYTHVRGFTRRSACLVLEDAGFCIESVWRMGSVPLSNRLRFVSLVPHIMKVPGLHQVWASSWELKARK